MADSMQLAAPEVSVVVCTRNRAEALNQFLTTFERIDVPAGLRWEIVIVDNGSTDATKEIILSRRERLPLRYVYEQRPGLSNARNCGVDVATGDYLVWTDDDVLVQPSWLTSYVTAFRTYPEIPVFGGNVRPLLQEGGAPWFAALAFRFPELLAARQFDEGHLFGPGDMKGAPYGANYAVRRVDQQRRRYNPELGVGSPLGLMGEETDVIQAILRETGTVGRWVAEAEVIHAIPASRQCNEYIWKYYYHQGMTTGWSSAKAGISDRLNTLLLTRLKFACAGLRYRIARFARLRATPAFMASLAFWTGRRDFCRIARAVHLRSGEVALT